MLINAILYKKSVTRQKSESPKILYSSSKCPNVLTQKANVRRIWKPIKTQSVKSPNIQQCNIRYIDFTLILTLVHLLF